MIGLIDVPSSGTIEFAGRDAVALADDEKSELRSRSIGFVFQQFNLVPVLSALENIMLPLQIQGDASKIAREKAVASLKEMELADYLDHRPQKLPGGQQQRVAIARALVTKPRLVIADEPTANLDSENALKIIDLMREMGQRKGTTFVFSTHDQRLIDRVQRLVHLQDTTGGVVKRLALDILLFRSLLKNEKVELEAPQRILFRTSTLLWLGAMAFHWSLLVILLRHLRFFLEPVPSAVVVLQRLDSIFQNLLPILYISDVVILIALGYLLLRRVIYPQVKYISIPSDYFVLLMIAGIALSGVLMRLIFKVDLVQVKEWVMAMLSFRPMPPKGVNLLFYIHLFFVSLLVAYFPLSKLMHMPGSSTSSGGLRGSSRR